MISMDGSFSGWHYHLPGETEINARLNGIQAFLQNAAERDTQIHVQ
jgi:hypothetical protein